jgi:sulfide:quinone oxidoreductase
MFESAARDRGQPSRVVIAGAGVAGLEAAAALRSLAGDRVTLTLIAPDARFVHRPLEPYEAFGIDAPPPVALAALAGQLDARLVVDRVGWVDREDRVVHCRSGAAYGFDALVLGVGARPGARYKHALTVDDTVAGDLRSLTADVVAGRVTRLALIVPERMAWPLPLYEVALMTATLAEEHHRELAITLITAEAAPLHAFGYQVHGQMTALLRQHGVEVLAGSRCEVPAPDHVVVLTNPHGPSGRDLAVDRVLALPELFGPHIRGLPCAEYGFIPIDRFCRVPGLTAIHAAGDGTDYPIKHGGLAAQQAGVAATCIAAACGAPVRVRAFHPTLEGTLLTGGRSRHLSARLTGGQPFGSRMGPAVADAPTASAKLAAPYLTALLQEVSG